MRWSAIEHNKHILKEWPQDFIMFHASLSCKSTEPTNVFKSGVKKTGQCAPAIFKTGLESFHISDIHIIYKHIMLKAMCPSGFIDKQQ